MDIPVVCEDVELLPRYARPGDAGADLRATSDHRLEPGQRVLVGTGVRVELPEGTVGLVTPRSGRAMREGLSIVNSPGIIDSGYRGEIKVCLVNLDPHNSIEIRRGERMAQLVVMPYLSAHFTRVETLEVSQRGEEGYGSTGHE